MVGKLRYVVAIADTDTAALDDLAANHFEHWPCVFEGPRVRAWIKRSMPTALGYQTVEPFGCVIGLAMQPIGRHLDKVLERTWGAYVAIRSDARGAVSVTRDPTGRVECWRISHPGAQIYFSHYEDVWALQRPPWTIDWDYLAHHLNQDYLHGEATALAGVSELLPGQTAIHEGASQRRLMAWRPEHFAVEPHRRPDEARVALRRSAEQAVEAWAGRYSRIALDLSGGLDSSIMLGLLRDHVGHPSVLAATRTTAGEEGDERSYARAAAAMHGVVLKEQTPVAVKADLSAALPRLLMRPRGRMLDMGYDQLGITFAKANGSEAFFTGTGGDHLFFDHLPAFAICDYLRHGGSIAGLVGEALNLARLSKGTVWSVLAETRRLGRRGWRAVDDLVPRFNGFLTAAAIGAASFERYLHPSALAAARTLPPAKALQILNILELQRHYYRFGRADVVEETHPFISQPVLEACLRTPSHWFGAGGMQRGLARQAFGDLLPDEVRFRRSKGGNTSYWLRFLQARLPQIRTLLMEGRLADRGFLDRGRMASALTPMGLAAGRDFMAINICLTAELWVRAVETARREASAPKGARRATA